MSGMQFVRAFVALLLVGCTQPLDTRIDGSSMAAYEQSLKAIKAKLSPDETTKFDEALKVVVLSEMVPTEGGLLGIMAAMKDPEKVQAKMLATVNGKTPRELIAQADAKIKERAKEELKSVVSEIAALEMRKAVAYKPKELLSKFTVADPRFYWGGSPYYPEPVLDFKVTNNAGIALSRVYYHGVVSTPGRTIPWIDEDFNNELAGGLENGETKHLRLAPNRFTKWGAADTQGRKDLVFTVTVVNADGPDKAKLAEEFGKSDEERLKKLLVMKLEIDQRLASR